MFEFTLIKYRLSVLEKSKQKNFLPNEKKYERKWRKQVFILSHEMNVLSLTSCLYSLTHTE